VWLQSASQGYKTLILYQQTMPNKILNIITMFDVFLKTFYEAKMVIIHSFNVEKMAIGPWKIEPNLIINQI
jgi:hypothetical protein